MPKKIILLVLLLMITNTAFANKYYQAGEQYLNNYQYSSAIEQFKNAIRQYPNDYNSRVGLINAYLARAAYDFNTLKDYQKALNDSRSGLFYIKYYDNEGVNATMQAAAEKTERNIKEILNILKPDTSAEGLLKTAKQLRNQGEIPSSFVVYQQLINTKYDKEASIASGDILRIMKNPSLALVYYKKVLVKEPNNYDILIKLGECYQETGNANLAAENFNKALSISGNSQVALDNLEKIWRQQIYKTPSDAEAHANLGVIYQNKGDYTAAMAEYQKAEQLNPNNMTTKLNLGTLYQAQGQYENAITLYDKVLFSNAENLDARKFKAQCLQALNKNEEALVEFKRVLAFDPNNSDAKNAILTISSKSGDSNQYLNILNETIKDPIQKANALYSTGYEFHKNKKYKEAKDYYLKALELNPNQSDIYLNLSDIYLQLNDKTAAINILNDGKTKFPQNTQIAERLKSFQLAQSQQVIEDGGQALLKGDYEKALSLYKSIQPATEDSLLGIASTYQTMGKYAEAIEYYKKVYLMNQNNPETAYYIASAYVAMEDLSNAKTYVNLVLAKNPNHQNAKTLLKYINEEETQKSINSALDLYNSKKYNEAYNLLSSMISKNPSSAVAYYYRGMVLDEQNKYDMAILDYKNTLKYDSTFDLAYYSLGVDYDNLKNYKEAFSYYNKYLKATSEQNEYTEFVNKRIEELKKYVPNLTQTK